MKLSTCIKRAILGCCPNCGKKTLRKNKFQINDICSDCGIRFVEKPGDDWAFLLLLDRAVFIFPIIAIYYLSIDTITVFTAVIIGVFFMISFIIFTPQRLGVSKAIEYWIRIGRKNG